MACYCLEFGVILILMELYCPGILKNKILGEILSRRSKWTGDQQEQEFHCLHCLLQRYSRSSFVWLDFVCKYKVSLIRSIFEHKKLLGGLSVKQTEWWFVPTTNPRSGKKCEIANISRNFILTAPEEVRKTIRFINV